MIRQPYLIIKKTYFKSFLKERGRILSKILGIDVGTNSLGWAILDPLEKRFTDAGVIVFQQGIPNEKGTKAELSPAAERQNFRAMRRLKFRRRLRKYHVLKILIENHMCPLSMPELQNWIRKGVFPIGNRDFIAWLGSTKEANPYYFRAKAAERKLPPMELGRAFYHLAIRRGFKSSRKDADDSGDKDLSEFKKGISSLSEALRNRQCTLGQYFYELFRSNQKIRKVNRCGRVEHYEPEFETICRVQGLPADFVSKMRKALFFQRPLRSQKHLAGHCSLEKKHVRCLIGHPLFERYRMLSFLNSIRKKDGRALTAEERKKAESAFYGSKPSFEFKKLLQKVYPKEYRSLAEEFNYPPDKSIASSPVTAKLQKVLGTDDLFAWRHEYAGRDGKTRVMDYQTLFDALTFFDDNDLLKKFAVERAGLTPEQAEEFIRIRIPSGYANFSLCAIRKIMPFLEAGQIQTRALFLAKLPELLGKEVFRQNSGKIIAELERIEEEWRSDQREALAAGRPGAFLSQTERMKRYLEDEFSLTPDRFEQLYRYNSRSDYPDNSASGILPPVNLGMIYNPMVYRSLTVLRRLVNHLRRSGKIDASTEIHVELARSVNNKNTRLAIAAEQKEQEKRRQEARGQIEANGGHPSDEMILRWILWKEQKEHCLYTGKAIGIADLLSPANLVEIEHTVPRSRGGDSSMENLTLCFTDYNRYIKKNSLPTACPNYESPWKDCNSIQENLKAAGWEEERSALISRVEKLRTAARGNPQKRPELIQAQKQLDYWDAKLAAFQITDEELKEKGFSKRQLVDTGIVARHAVFLLKSVYRNTYSRNGKVTEWARKAWGVQEFYKPKDRSDHKHHAVDAMCVAALTEGFFQRISTAYRSDELSAALLEKEDSDESASSDASSDSVKSLPEAYPWPTFPQDVYEKTDEILIFHAARHNETKQSRKQVHLVTPYRTPDGQLHRVVTSGGDSVRGQLHKESYYGRIKDPSSGTQRSVIRQEFVIKNFPSEASFEDIVDPAVREMLLEQIHAREDQGRTFKEAMDEGDFRMKTKDKVFNGPPIRSVRCFARLHDPLKIRKQTYSSSAEYKNYLYADTAKGGNFRAALFRSPEGKLSYRLQSLWEWATQRKDPDYIPPEEESGKGEFLGFIFPGTMVLTYENSPEELKTLSPRELRKRLYKIIEIKKSSQPILRLRYHREARAGKDVHAAMKEETGVEESASIDFRKPAKLLKIRREEISGHLIFEGIDFAIAIDGEIHFLK